LTVHLRFHGAARTVTGSCVLVEHPGGRFLVDCGLFQGNKTIRSLNYGGFPFDPKVVDFVLLSHAHIDHSGLVPKLARHGFAGPIYATEGTRDLLTYMLPDSGYIQETEVEHLNRRNAQRGLPPVDPIYTKRDAEAALERIEVVDLDRWITVGEGVRARLWHAGHILGAASVEVLVADGKDRPPYRLLFSGDIGPAEKAFHEDPEAPGDVDFLVVEGTYGDTERADRTPEARRAALKAEVAAALERGGNLLIPAFAVERTQELLYDLAVLFDAGELPETPVFLDSPLAIRATEVFERHLGDLPRTRRGHHPFRRRNFRFTADAAESKKLNSITSGAIIIAASGMCDAGRIRHHLANNLWRPKATVLLVGYQAPGTLGHLLENGAKSVRIHGRETAVRAHVASLDVYSAHADRGELNDWVMERMPVRRGVFLTHGEPEALEGLRRSLIDAGFDDRLIYIPRLDEAFRLSDRGRLRHRLERPRVEPEALPATDWHNDYAAFLLDLAEWVRETRDDRERRAMLGRLRDVLTESERPSGR
jgi:metallo-beta-lactamase family protein